MPDKENNLDVDALQLLILAGILNMENGHIIAITIAHNVMQENNYHFISKKGLFFQEWG
jgi:hypothetical protein